MVHRPVFYHFLRQNVVFDNYCLLLGTHIWLVVVEVVELAAPVLDLVPDE